MDHSHEKAIFWGMKVIAKRQTCKLILRSIHKQIMFPLYLFLRSKQFHPTETYAQAFYTTYKYPGVATEVAFWIIWSWICFPVQPNWLKISIKTKKKKQKISTWHGKLKQKPQKLGSHLIANNCRTARARLIMARLASRIFWGEKKENR